MSGGGSGGSGTQKYEWNDSLKPLWESALAQGQQLSGKPYNPYPYDKIAGINGDQNASMDAIRGWANQGGTGAGIAANNQAEKTLNGDYLNSNPYASAGNPYSGFGTQFSSVVNDEMGNIANNYKQGTSAETTRLFNQAGAFGGSAHQNAIANNEAALAKQLGQVGNSMYNDQFNRSAGLTESDLSRGSGAYDAERNRQMGAIQGGQNSNQQFLQGANALMGVGDINRGFQQDQYNQYFNDWQQQQNYPQSQLDYFTGLLGRAQGGISPNSTTTQSGYAASPYSQILGAGLMGYGLTH